MHEPLKEALSYAEELEVRSVTIFVQTKSFTLSGHWQWDLLSDAVFCSDVMFNFPESFVGTKGIVHPDDLEHLYKNIYFSEAIGEDENFDLEFRIITTYNQVRKLTGKKVKFKNIQQQGVLPDPVKALLEKSAEEADFSNEHEFLTLQREILEFSEKIHQVGGWYFNLSTRETWYSDNHYRLFGLPPQSLNAQLYTFANFLHPDDKDLVLEAINASVRDVVPLDIHYRIIRADDHVRYVEHTTQIAFNRQGQNVIFGVLKDITREKQQELELEEAESVLDLQNRILEFTDNSIDVGHWRVDLLTRKYTFSDNYYNIFGLRPYHFVASLTTIGEFVHPDDRARFIEAHRNLIIQNTIPDFEFKIIRADGKVRQILLKGKLVTTSKSEMVMIGTIKDVTHERLADKKLKDISSEVFVKELGYRIAEQTAGMAGWIWELSTEKYTWSSNFFSLLGIKTPADFSVNTLMKYIYPDKRDLFANHLANPLAYPDYTNIEFRLITRGDAKRFRATFKTVNEDGKTFVVCVIQDVTENYKLEQKLAEELRFTEQLANCIDNKVIVVDTHYSIIDWNQRCEVAFGRKKGQVLNQNYFDVFPALKNSGLIKLFNRALGGETISEEMEPNSYLKGHHRISLSPLKDAKGNIVGIFQLLADKTKETELQQSISHRLNFIENIVEAAIDPLIVLDKHLNYLYWNKQSELIFGINREYVLGKNVLEIMPVMPNSPTSAQFKQVLKGDTTYIPAKENEDGYFYEIYLVPIKDEKGQVTGVLWMLHNLTSEMQLVKQQNEYAKKLQEEHKRLKEAQAIGRIGSFEWTAATGAIIWSDELYRIYGLEPQSEVITFERLTSFIHPDDLEEFLEVLRECRTKATSYSTVHRIIRTDGVERTLVRQLQSFVNEEGAVIQISGTVQDITEQHKVEEKLKEQSYFLSRITETIPDMVSVMELPSHKLCYMNTKVFAANGFDVDMMAGKSREDIETIIHPDDREMLSAYYEKLSTAGDEETVTAEYRAKNDRGEWKWFCVRGKVFQRDANRRVTQILNAMENITERKHAQQQILQLKDEIAQKATDKYRALFNSINEGFYLCEVLFDENDQPFDVRCVEENPAAIRLFGMSCVGKTMREARCDHYDDWFQLWGNVALTGESKRMEQYSERDKKWFEFYITQAGGESSRLAAVIFRDITQCRRTEKEP